MALGGARVNSSVALKLVSICCSGFYQLLSENTITSRCWAINDPIFFCKNANCRAANNAGATRGFGRRFDG